MCQPASFVITKKQVFWSKTTEGHSDIIEEFGLKEKDVRGNITLVRIEIVPPDGNYKLPFSKWEYHLDQDLLPKWYDGKEVEKRARKHLKEWRKCKVIMPNEERNVKEGDFIIISYGTVNDNSGTVNDNYGTVNDNSGTVNDNSGTVNDNSGTVNDNSGTVNDNSGTVNDNYGTVNDNSGTVKRNGNSGTVKRNNNSGTVNYNSGTVKKCIGKSTVITYVKLDKGILQSANAVLVDRSGKEPKFYVGK